MPLDYAIVKDWRFDEVRQRYDGRTPCCTPWASAWGQDPEDERQLRYVYERDLLAFPTMSVVRLSRLLGPRPAHRHRLDQGRTASSAWPCTRRCRPPA